MDTKLIHSPADINSVLAAFVANRATSESPPIKSILSSKIQPGTPIARLRRKTHERSQSHGNGIQHSKSSSLGGVSVNSDSLGVSSGQHNDTKPKPPPRARPRKSIDGSRRSVNSTPVKNKVNQNNSFINVRNNGQNNSQGQNNGYSNGRISREFSSIDHTSSTSSYSEINSELANLQIRMNQHPVPNNIPQSQTFLISSNYSNFQSPQTQLKPGKSQPHLAQFSQNNNYASSNNQQNSNFQNNDFQNNNFQSNNFQNNNVQYNFKQNEFQPNNQFIIQNPPTHFKNPQNYQTDTHFFSNNHDFQQNNLNFQQNQQNYPPQIFAQVAPTYQTPICARPVHSGITTVKNLATPQPQPSPNQQSYNQKSAYVWNNKECCDWLRTSVKYCTNFHIESFRQHEVDGKCLLKLDAGKIGMIFSAEWSEPILKSVLEEIGKLKIKTHHDEFKSYEFQSMYQMNS